MIPEIETLRAEAYGWPTQNCVILRDAEDAVTAAYERGLREGDDGLPSMVGRAFGGVPDSVIDLAEDAYMRECGELPVRDALRQAVCVVLAARIARPSVQRGWR